MRDLYEEFLNWLAKELNTNYEYDFAGRFLDDIEYTDDEYYDFMQQFGKYDLVVITDIGWEKCKENIQY